MPKFSIFIRDLASQTPCTKTQVIDTDAEETLESVKNRFLKRVNLQGLYQSENAHMYFTHQDRPLDNDSEKTLNHYKIDADTTLVARIGFGRGWPNR